jgi:hypothetical protein
MICYFFTEDYVKENLFKAFEQMARFGGDPTTVDYNKI